eukprot:COSAG04_NODE_4451_length_2084_cov_1.743202_2_plen_433_part_00
MTTGRGGLGGDGQPGLVESADAQRHSGGTQAAAPRQRLATTQGGLRMPSATLSRRLGSAIHAPSRRGTDPRDRPSYYMISGQATTAGGQVLRASMASVMVELPRAAARAQMGSAAATASEEPAAAEARDDSRELADLFYSKEIKRPDDMADFAAATTRCSHIFTAHVQHVPGTTAQQCEIFRFMNLGEIAGEESLKDALFRVGNILDVRSDNGRRLYAVLYAGMVGSTNVPAARQLAEMFTNTHGVFDLLRQWDMVFSKIFTVEAKCKVKGMEKQFLAALQKLLEKLGLPACINESAGLDGTQFYITIVLLDEMESTVGKLRQPGMPLHSDSSRLASGARRDRDADEACARAGVPSPRISAAMIAQLRQLCDSNGLGRQCEEIILHNIDQRHVLGAPAYYSHWQQAGGNMATHPYHHVRTARCGNPPYLRTG